MSGTRLCQLLAEWAAEDKAMSDLYESISLDEARKIIGDSLFPGKPTLPSSDEEDGKDAPR